MARFNDKIGYGQTVEDPSGSGIFVDQITEFSYYGDVVRNIRRLDGGEPINDDISVQNSISIVADEYANQHIFAMRYVRWAGVRWTITSVEVRPPRLILSLGTVYNGPVPTQE